MCPDGPEPCPASDLDRDGKTALIEAGLKRGKDLVASVVDPIAQVGAALKATFVEPFSELLDADDMSVNVHAGPATASLSFGSGSMTLQVDPHIVLGVTLGAHGGAGASDGEASGSLGTIVGGGGLIAGGGISASRSGSEWTVVGGIGYAVPWKGGGMFSRLVRALGVGVTEDK